MTSIADDNSIMEKQNPSDTVLCRRLSGNPHDCRAKDFTDEELLAKLRTLGLDLNRSAVEKLLGGERSADDIIHELVGRSIFKNNQDDLQCDWIWACFAELRRRWFPNKPAFWALDDKMQRGYELLERGDTAAACRIWLDAWSDVLAILDKTGVQSISEFDTRFDGIQSLHNWIQDLETELWNAGLSDRQFHTARIAVCEEAMRRFTAEHVYASQVENWRSAVAETYFRLGEAERAEQLYRGWLQEDPCWGWGWISWSDCYSHGRAQLRNVERSEELLQEGLSVAEVRDRELILDRLADIREEEGRTEEARELRQQSEAIAGPVPRQGKCNMEWEQILQRLAEPARNDRTLSPGTNAALPKASRPAPGTPRKTGPNEFCPCGSNKKFKKCCGQKA